MVSNKTREEVSSVEGHKSSPLISAHNDCTSPQSQGCLGTVVWQESLAGHCNLLLCTACTPFVASTGITLIKACATPCLANHTVLSRRIILVSEAAGSFLVCLSEHIRLVSAHKNGSDMECSGFYQGAVLPTSQPPYPVLRWVEENCPASVRLWPACPRVCKATSFRICERQAAFCTLINPRW